MHITELKRVQPTDWGIGCLLIRAGRGKGRDGRGCMIEASEDDGRMLSRSSD